MSFKDQYGPWAFISGASAGLGEIFARQLADKGMNLVLAARREDRLKALAQELTQKHGIECRTVAVDLGGEDVISAIEPATADIEVGLLVNNAGFTNSGEFLDNSLDSELLLLHVNCRAAMVLAHHFGQKLRERGRGGIIFSASVAGHAGIPFWANYSASKSYDLLLAEALAGELKPHGVDVLALCPGTTATEFANYRGALAKLMVMRPEPVVAQALKKLGRRHTTVTGLMNLATVFSMRLVPRRVASWLAGVIIRDMLRD